MTRESAEQAVNIVELQMLLSAAMDKHDCRLAIEMARAIRKALQELEMIPGEPTARARLG